MLLISYRGLKRAARLGWTAIIHCARDYETRGLGEPSLPALHTSPDFSGKKRIKITGVHDLGPPPKRRKHDQNALPPSRVISPRKRSTTPLLPPKRTVIELDSDGEETGSKKVRGCVLTSKLWHSYSVKQKVKKEPIDNSEDDSDSEYSRIHAGFDLRDCRIVSSSPKKS